MATEWYVWVAVFFSLLTVFVNFAYISAGVLAGETPRKADKWIWGIVTAWGVAWFIGANMASSAGL